MSHGKNRNFKEVEKSRMVAAHDSTEKEGENSQPSA